MENKYSVRLRNTLDLLDIKQSELARKTGITEATISNYINAKKIPQLGVVEKIADVLNVSVDYLLGRTNKLRTTENDSPLDVSKLTKSEIDNVALYIHFLEFRSKQDKRETI